MWLGLYMLSISNCYHQNQITNGRVVHKSEQLEKYQLLTIYLLNPGSLRSCATSKQSNLNEKLFLVVFVGKWWNYLLRYIYANRRWCRIRTTQQPKSKRNINLKCQGRFKWNIKFGWKPNFGQWAKSGWWIKSRWWNNFNWRIKSKWIERARLQSYWM